MSERPPIITGTIWQISCRCGRRHEYKRDVAMTYAFAIRQGETDRIGEVNRAIVERWSMAALRYVKDEAWRIVRGKRSRALGR